MRKRRLNKKLITKPRNPYVVRIASTMFQLLTKHPNKTFNQCAVLYIKTNEFKVIWGETYLKRTKDQYIKTKYWKTKVIKEPYLFNRKKKLDFIRKAVTRSMPQGGIMSLLPTNRKTKKLRGY